MTSEDTAESKATAEVIALRVLPTAVRCREVGGGLVTYRRTLPAIVPGELLRVGVARRWTFRRTAMVGGDLLAVSFAPEGLDRAGLERPRLLGGALTCPGDGAPHLRDGLGALRDGLWISARCHLLDQLEEHPGCLVAHSALAEILMALHHLGGALSHATAAVRLGEAAASGRAPLHPAAGGVVLWPARPSGGSVREWLARSAVTRAEVLAACGRQCEALDQLHQASLWEGGGDEVVRQALARLQAPPRKGRRQ